MNDEVFRVRDGALDIFLTQIGTAQGCDVSGGLERSGFVPKLRTLVDPAGSAEFSIHPRDMATQIAWFSYLFIAQHDGLERPEGFPPKPIITEAVDGPYMTNAVRISLWSDAAVFKAVSNEPIAVDQFKHPDG